MNSFENIVTLVSNIIGDLILQDMRRWIDQKKPLLVGLEKPRIFPFQMLVLTLYHDLESIGITRILKTVEIHNSIANDTLNENMKRIRECLSTWSDNFIKIGDSTQWNYAARRHNFPEKLQRVNLWIDSSDFPVAKCEDKDTNKFYYSHKLKRTGRRVMVIRDGRGIVRYISRPYSPLTHDANFLEEKQEFIRDNFSGGHIIGDLHFTTGKKLFQDPVFYTGKHLPRPKKRKHSAEEQEEFVKHTKKAEKENSEVAGVRANVENAFAFVKNHFKSLDSPWLGDVEQFFYVIKYACAISNFRKNRNL